MSTTQPTLSCLTNVKRDRYAEKKRKCVDQMKQYLNESVLRHGRAEKIIIARKIFRFLSTHNCRNILIKDHPKFKTTVRNKLIEFYKIENWTEAKYWYEKIFNKPIPDKFV